MNDSHHLQNQQEQLSNYVADLEPMQVQSACEDGILRLIKAMESALKEAAAENMPPLPSAIVSYNSRNTQNNNNNNTSRQNQQQQQVDTTIVRREKWENVAKSRLTPLAEEVQNACADLHDCLGMLNEFGLNAAACEREKDNMLIETARIEERVVVIFRAAARKKEELMGELKNMAKVI